jgi:hypothetical protein
MSVAACSGPLAMHIHNRTETTVAVVAGRSTVVVVACGERTLVLEGG